MIALILQVVVTLLLFFGWSSLALSYDEYVSVLSLIGILAGSHLFSCLVVFQFRKNLIEDAGIREALQRAEIGHNVGAAYYPFSIGAGPSAPMRDSPPPTYDEVSKTSPPEILLAAAKHLQMEEHLGDGKESKDGAPPPEYDAAMKKEKEMKEGASAAEEEFNLDITDDEADIKPPTAGLFVGLVSNNC